MSTILFLILMFGCAIVAGVGAVYTLDHIKHWRWYRRFEQLSATKLVWRIIAGIALAIGGAIGAIMFYPF